MGIRGPASSVTPEQQGRMVGLLMIGMSQADARTICGLSRSAVVRACNADPEFARQLRVAVLRGKAELLLKIYHADNWRAAAWMLERRWPEEFGRRNPDQYSKEQVAALAMTIRSALLRFIPADRHAEPDSCIEAALKEMRYKRWKPRRLIGAG